MPRSWGQQPTQKPRAPPSTTTHPQKTCILPPSLTEMFVFGWMDVLVQFRFDVFLNRTRIGWKFLCFLLVWMNLILINLVIFFNFLIFFASVKLCAVGWTQAELIFHVICTPEFIQLWAALQTRTKSRTAHKGSTQTSHCVCLFVLQTVKELGCQEQQKTSISSENA